MFFVDLFNLRGKQSRKRRQSFKTDYSTPKKRLRSFDHISSLPDEILLYIFSFLQIEDLYFNVRLVCRKWHGMAMVAPPWKVVVTGNYLPTHILRNWIQLSPIIRHFKISNRNDANVILKHLTRHSVNLESIVVENCWGSTRSVYLESVVLCKLLTKCKKLEKIHFEKVKIRSCKFFALLAKRGFGKFAYIGPVTAKQYKTLREASSGWITEFTEVN